MADYRDRSTALVAFGVLEIILGSLTLLMVPLTAVSMLAANSRGGATAGRVALLPAMVSLSLVAAVYIWLGIGSLLGRRWARTLWVCVSGFTFCLGVLALPMMMYVTAHLGDRAKLPLIHQIIAAAFFDGFLFLAFFAIPAAIYLFYCRQDVRRTCEAKDLQTRWTDRCPESVLALSLFLALGAVSFLPVPNLSGHPDFVRQYVGRMPSHLLTALTAGVWLYVAWGLYRLRRDAWWLALAAFVPVAFGRVMTSWLGVLAPFHPATAFRGRTGSAALNGLTWFRWYHLIWLVVWLGWLLYVRRYLPKASQPSDQGFVTAT